MGEKGRLEEYFDNELISSRASTAASIPSVRTGKYLFISKRSSFNTYDNPFHVLHIGKRAALGIFPIIADVDVLVHETPKLTG